MKYQSMSPFTLPLLAVLLFALGPLTGCSHEDDNAKGNQIPFIRITGGPPDSMDASYNARIWWTGWDFDGIIDHYEYTVDPPAAFTEDEVDHPERYLVGNGGPLQLRILRGPLEDTDTLRFTKTVDGAAYTMDYIQTRDFSRVFSFATPHPDSGSDGGIRVARQRYSGFHTTYVRSQDNEGAYSDAAHLAYTATTITPEAEITNPKSTSGTPLTVGTQVEVRWDGFDADSPEARKKPTSYLYKLVQLGSLDPPMGVVPIPNAPFVMYTRSKHIPWIEQSAETTSVRFFLETGEGKNNYMFALRAKDVAGSVEPVLTYGRNAFIMSVQSQGGKPELTVTEPSLGSHTFRGSGEQPVRWQVPTGQRLFFEWHGNADLYGGTIEGYNYGVNIPDVEREGPNSGWRGWSTELGNFEPIYFNKPGVNVIYVRVRDTGGSQTIGTIVLTVVEFQLDRELLIVDDYKDGTFPRDDVHDKFWTDLVANSGRFTEEDQKPEILMFHSLGLNDAYFTSPVIPDLLDLGRYKMIFYDTHGGGSGGFCGLTESGPRRRHLGSYLGAGGKLWISGVYTAGAMIPTVTGSSTLIYPLEIPDGSFPYEYMKIYQDVRNDKNDANDIHGMIGVRPFPGRPDEAVLPPMNVEVNKMNPALRGIYGIGVCDVIFDPLFQTSNADFTGEIDSLYVFKAIGPTKTPARSSPYEGKLCGIRWFDRDVNRRHGRTMWFGFPMYYFYQNEAQETFNMAVDWFREETPGEATPKTARASASHGY